MVIFCIVVQLLAMGATVYLAMDIGRISERRKLEIERHKRVEKWISDLGVDHLTPEELALLRVTMLNHYAGVIGEVDFAWAGEYKQQLGVRVCTSAYTCFDGLQISRRGNPHVDQ